MRLRRKRVCGPERRPALEILHEATQLRNEIALCKPGFERMEAITLRMRELAVEIDALAPEAVAPAGSPRVKDTMPGRRDRDEAA